MPVVELRDKTVIESFLRSNPELHLYSIGDLDDFFWPFTTWYGLVEDGAPVAVALLYRGPVPTLLALDDHLPRIRSLTESIYPRLPEVFHSHLSPGLEYLFAGGCEIEPHGAHIKMALLDRSAAEQVDDTDVIRLSTADLEDIDRLYARSYPENWFDLRMLETGQYFGIRRGGELVSIAGIHVYSETYRVAALGNVTTDPKHRNTGLGTRVTARLVRSLCRNADHVGLNVKADNRAAIALYEKLGFEAIARFGEFLIRKIPG